MPNIETVQTEDDAKLLTEEKLSKDNKVWLLTLLIEDRRPDNKEAQVAEMRVRLKAAAHGGFWTDACEICENLQSGPFRIDGKSFISCTQRDINLFYALFNRPGQSILLSRQLPTNLPQYIKEQRR